MAGHSPEEISAERRVYVTVFASLGVLTLVTVAVASLDLSTGAAIFVALAIASVKGSLVACYFMHLIGERKLIYAVLALTFFFFLVLIFLPLAAQADRMGG